MKTHNFRTIPEEMQSYRQWIVWRHEQTDTGLPTKVLYTRYGIHASVTDASSWCEFEDAIAAFETGPWSGIGFVFTKRDPFAGIDCDKPKTGTPEEITEIRNRQTKIIEAFNSYTEWSPSGEGMHIIVKGAVPSGRRRDSVEVYSDRRYFTMTGNAYYNRPIADAQGLLDWLYQQMSNKSEAIAYAGNSLQREDDATVYANALRAVNGDKFNNLWNGNWELHYQSQSEADHALINILQFYTNNREQIKRMFRGSALGVRKKAQRNDYLDNMINRSFDRMIDIDMTGLSNEIDDAIAALPEPMPVAEMNAPASALQPPRGLVGEIAKFIYWQAPYPSPEIAITGALGMVAGIVGRAFNVSGSGLNLYLLVLARTGSGKEAISTGTNALIEAVRTGEVRPGTDDKTPSIEYFRGPSEIASGQALHKELARNPCFFSIVGEFGLRFSNMADPKGGASEKSLKRTLLEAYGKSGKSQTLGKMVYSDKENDVSIVRSPALTIIGESTPETFLRVVTELVVQDGLLPRFLVINYPGHGIYNPSHEGMRPSQELVRWISDLVMQVHAVNHVGSPSIVKLTDDAQKFAKDYQQFCEVKKREAGDRETPLNMWTRAHMKVLRVAAVIAVGANMSNPTIEVSDLEWAADVVNRDIEMMLKRFEQGETGEQGGNHSVQQSFILRLMADYLIKDWAQLIKYGVQKDAHDNKVISHSYLSKRCLSQIPFKEDKAGASNAFKRAIQDLIDNGDISQLPPKWVADTLNGRAKYYALHNVNVLKN